MAGRTAAGTANRCTRPTRCGPCSRGTGCGSRPDAGRYLLALANLPDSGALRTCVNLVAMATTIHEHAGSAALTADMLRGAHRLLVSRDVFAGVEQRLADERPLAAARPQARAG